MFSPYRKLFAVPGALRFSIAGSIARLPISMTLLSITFVIVHIKHSYTLAGTVATGAALISTVFSPTWSRYADRLGQRKVLRFTIPFYIAFDLIFLIAIYKHAPTYIWMTAIFLADLTGMEMSVPSGAKNCSICSDIPIIPSNSYRITLKYIKYSSKLSLLARAGGVNLCL